MMVRWKIPCRHLQPGGYIPCLVTPRRILLIILGLFVSILILTNWGLMCLNREMDRVMNTLCEQAGKGEALGDMCLELCEVDTVEPVQCQAGHESII